MQKDRHFKARPVETKMFIPKITSAKKLETSPFNLQTEKRAQEHEKSASECDQSTEKGFKARPMPEYNFFEPKRSEEKPKVEFAEFKLNTEERNA